MAEIHTQFENFLLVTDELGFWPDFHDAEVVSLSLDRNKGPRGKIGPCIRVEVETLNIELPRNDPSQHKVSITLSFSDIYSIKLMGFDHQNAVNGIEITTDKSKRFGKYVVRFLQGQGVDATFSCELVTVMSVKRI
jgi:hypothetical protein